jgi:hypothetical protein
VTPTIRLRKGRGTPPFKITFEELEDLGPMPGRLGDNIAVKQHDLYFNNGATLQKSSSRALELMRGWGGTVPLVANFGRDRPVVGASKAIV